jgi:uncharacterized membrane protein YesL
MMVAEQQKGDIDWMEVFNTVTTFVLFNMLWLFGSLLIVTIPAVTAALFASVAPWARGQSPYTPLLSFLTAVRRYWFKATVIGILDLVLGGLVAFNLLSIRQMGLEQFIALPALILTVFLTATLILTNLYVWPLLVTLDQPLALLLKNGLRLTVAHPFWGTLVAVAASIPLVVSLLLPRFFFLTVSFAAAVLITYWGAWRMIRRYLDEDDLQELGV